jgi:DNA sulfur modification protein DndD
VKLLEVDRAKAARRQEELTSLLDEHREELDALMERVGPFLADGRGSGSNLQEELDRAVVRSRALDEQILGALETVIVPALPSSLTAQLLKRLDGEARFASWTEGKRKVEPQLDKLCASIFGPGADKPTPPLTEGQRRFLEQLLRREWENLFHPPPPDVAPDPRHDRLAPAELDAVRAKLQEVLHGSTVDLGTVLEEREALSRRIMDLESRINAVAEGDELNAMLSRRDDLNRRIGELQAQFDEVIRQLAFIDQNLGEKRRQHAQATREAQGDGVPAPERLRFCNDLQEIVRKFQERRRPQKVREVKDRLIEMFRCLARKEDVIQDISIDDKTFHIRLLDRRQKQVPMRDLSAGEKEIFAISLLWALGNASGRKLPVVIDTPLARLDRDHRQNIVRRYLPHAGTQVLILSTDTELDTQYLQYIEGSIANKYRLVFDNQAERTRIEPGYF